MSQEKILYISKKSAMAEKFAVQIESEYLLEQRKITVKSLYRELNNVSMILIYTTSFEKEEAAELYSFLTIMPTTYIPVVLMGSPQDMKREKPNLRYPIAAEIDITQRQFKLTKDIASLLRKFYPSQKVVASRAARKHITIYNRDAGLLERSSQVLAHDYDIATSDTIRGLFLSLGKQKTDLIVLDYSNASAKETEYLIDQLQANASTKSIPIMVYGEYMSNEQRAIFQKRQVKEILIQDEEILETKRKVDVFFSQKS